MPTTVSPIDAKSLLLGECVVYLGVLNYFFSVDESTPIVSRIGTEMGRLQLRVSPYVALEEEFAAYERVDVDSAEEQVHEYMDRVLQFRVELSRLSELAPQRFSHVSLRYTFFRETSTQTPRFRLDERGDSALDLEFRHAVDVSEALVKYLTCSNLAIEILGHTSGDAGAIPEISGPSGAHQVPPR